MSDERTEEVLYEVSRECYGPGIYLTVCWYEKLESARWCYETGIKRNGPAGYKYKLEKVTRTTLREEIK